MSEQEKEEAEKSKQLVERAFRWPKYVAAQRFISRLLLTAHCTNNQSEIVKNTTRAGMEVETLLGKDEKIEGVDFQLLKDLYNFDACLSAAQKVEFDGVWNPGQGWVYKKLYRIHWNFQEEKTNYEKLMAPWFRGVDCWSQFLKLSKERYLVVRCKKCSFTFLNEASQTIKEKMKEANVYAVEDQVESDGKKQKIFNFLVKTYGVKGTKTIQVENPGSPIYHPWKTIEVEVDCVLCPNCKQKLNIEDVTFSAKENVCWSRPWIVFYDETWNLTESGLAQLRTQFYVWAVKICADAGVKLCQVIDPDILKDIEQLMGAESKREEAKEE
jgi:hypothetical protein